MNGQDRRIGLAGSVLLTILLVSPGGRLAAQEAERLPLADLHFHAEQVLPPEEALRAMDRAGVRWAGNGPKGRDVLWRPFVLAAPERFLPFGGQGRINFLVRNRGEAAWTLADAETTRYLEQLEEGLRAGRFKGIGELFVNNARSYSQGNSPTRYPADAPLMQRLLRLAATYQAPLSVHMEADFGSVEELERLLPLNRKGMVIWAHCGIYADADLVRTLMARHSNLLCELSYRDDRYVGPRSSYVPITGFSRRLESDWKRLLEEHSDRFLIGVEVGNLSQYQSIIDFFRAILAQLTPDAARRIAYENAQQLFRLAKPREER